MTGPVNGLPYVDEHHVMVEAAPEAVWTGLRAYVGRTLASGHRTVLTSLLGTRPDSGFEVTEEVSGRRLVLSGRHRFSEYALVLELDPEGPQTVLRALTYARFPGPHGRVYRLLVIDSHAHALATNRILASIRAACLSQV